MDNDELERRSKNKDQELYQDDVIIGDKTMTWCLTEEEKKCKMLVNMVRCPSINWLDHHPRPRYTPTNRTH